MGADSRHDESSSWLLDSGLVGGWMLLLLFLLDWARG